MKKFPILILGLILLFALFAFSLEAFAHQSEDYKLQNSVFAIAQPVPVQKDVHCRDVGVIYQNRIFAFAPNITYETGSIIPTYVTFRINQDQCLNQKGDVNRVLKKPFSYQSDKA